MLSILDPQQVGEHLVVEVLGEIDVSTAPLLRDRLLALLNRGAPDLVVDLRSVTFIDSAGAGSLLRVHHRQLLLGGVVHFVVDDGPVLRMLQLLQLDRRLHLAPSVPAVPLCCSGRPAALDLEAGRAVVH